MAQLPPRGDILTGVMFADQSFQLLRRDEYSRTAGGSILARQLGGPVWKATYTTMPMYHDAAIGLETKLDTLDGSLRFFYAGDLRRVIPVKMKGVNFTDGGKITTTEQGRIINASGVAANLVLTRGDYVSFDYGAKPYRYLGRVVNAEIKPNASGVISGLELRPHLPPVSVVNATLRFKKPEALFVMDGSDAIKQSTVGGMFTVTSFTAVQAF